LRAEFDDASMFSTEKNAGSEQHDGQTTDPSVTHNKHSGIVLQKPG
jgi:hypothetical protein